jgi:hypothetical protein
MNILYIALVVRIIFTFDYNPTGSNFLVNEGATDYDQQEQTILALDNGDFIIAWSSSTSQTSSCPSNCYYNIYLNKYDKDSKLLTSANPILINEPDSMRAGYPALKANGDGFIVVYDYTNLLNQRDIKIRSFDSNLTPQTVSALNMGNVSASSSSNPSIDKLKNGNFIITWWGPFAGYNIWGRIMKPDLTPVGDAFTIPDASGGSQGSPVVLALQNGGFVIAWQTKVWNTSNNLDISVKKFNADGDADGEEKLLNTNNTTGDQSKIKMCTLSNGNIMATWNDISNDDISAVILTQSMEPSGEFFTVNTTTVNTQSMPVVKCLSSGGFIIAWQSMTIDKFSIIFQQFNNAGEKLGQERTVNTNTNFNMNEPSINEISGTKDIVIAWKSVGQISGSDIWAQRYYVDSGVCKDIQVLKGKQNNIGIAFTGFESNTIIIKELPVSGQLKDSNGGVLVVNTPYVKTGVVYNSAATTSDSFKYSTNAIDSPCKVDILVCYTSCANCITSGDINSHKCTQCDTSRLYYPFAPIEGNCFLNTNPPSGYTFDYSTNSFAKCYQACSNCSAIGTKAQTNCQGCAATYYPLPDNTSQCYLNTEKLPGYVYDGSAFEKCYTSCGTCDKIGDEVAHLCTSCKNNYSQKSDNFTMCYPNSSAIEGYYFDSLKNNFSKCYKLCKTCQGSGDALNPNCIDCAAGVKDCKPCQDKLYNDQCVKDCPDGTIYDEPTKRCKDCSAGMIIFNNECLSKCPDGLVLEDNTCIQCQSKHKFPYNGKCVSECPENSKLNPTSLICENDCKLGYYKEDKGSCVTCESEKKVFYDKNCYETCPEGTALSDKYCQKLLETVKETCENTKCQNNGLCGVKLNRVECQCRLPYLGRLCEYDVDTLDINSLVGNVEILTYR